MRQKIRLNTFETNSSSVHALALCNNDLFFDVQIGEKVIEADEHYGWNHRPLFTPREKLKYIYTLALSCSDSEFYEEKIKDAFSEYTFETGVNTLYYDYGVDHSDMKRNILDYAIRNPKLFLNNCIIFVSNDNCEFNSVFKNLEEYYDAKILVVGGN